MVKNLSLRLSILQFLQYFTWGSWFVTAGNYWLNGLNFEGRDVGLLYGCTAIAATISPFLIGGLTDRYFSVEKILGILHIIGSSLLYFIASTSNFDHIYFLILGYMLCFLPTFSLSNSLCFHHIDDPKNNFPRIRVWGTISWILIGFIVGFLKIENTEIPFYIASFSSLVLGIYCFTLPKTPPKLNKENTLLQNIFGPEMRTLMKDKSFLILLASMGLICIPSSYYYSFVNAFLNEAGVQNAAGKMAIGQITEIILILALPLIFQRIRLKIIMFIGLLMWGLRYGLFIIGIGSSTEIYYIIGLLMHGVAFTFASFAAQIYIDTRVPVTLKSTAQGFFSFLTLGIMALIGTFIAGETVSFYTFENGNHDWAKIWIIPFAVGMIVSLFFYLFFKSREKG